MEDALLLQEAIEFAALKHRGQFRKGNGRPYILHPLSVLNRLYVIKPNSKNIYLLAIVAILHDLVEDCGVTLEEIARMFGYRVASLVEELTSDKDQIDLLGKQEYLLRKMNNMSSYGLIIKLIDRLDNVSDMEDLKPEDRNKTIQQTEYILNGLDRKLTNTHKKLIKEIKNIINGK